MITYLFKYIIAGTCKNACIHFSKWPRQHFKNATWGYLPLLWLPHLHWRASKIHIPRTFPTTSQSPNDHICETSPGCGNIWNMTIFKTSSRAKIRIFHCRENFKNRLTSTDDSGKILISDFSFLHGTRYRPYLSWTNFILYVTQSVHIWR